MTREGRALEVVSAIRCTGFEPGLDGRGLPRRWFGKTTEVEGLRFAGLHFHCAVSSTMIHGAGQDARRMAHRDAGGRVA